jgi:hypothetical protein
MGWALALIGTALVVALAAGASFPLSNTAASKRRVIIGTNDGSGWGQRAASRIRAGHIAWDRVNLQHDGSPTPMLQASLRDGFRALAIVGNLDDHTPLASEEPLAWARRVVRQLRANPGVAIAEAGNEMYLKGGRPEPVQYGRMYLAGVNAMRAAGIRVPLLFDMRGDYFDLTTRRWSLDARGGGWLGDAVRNVPGLAAAILANGISVHPYGGLEENSHDTSGVRAVAADEALAQRVLGGIPRFYITEFGFNLADCGAEDGACSPAEQAAKLELAYASFLADPHVAGIWWYQSHADSTGDWGYMNHNSSARPAFSALARIAARQGGLGLPQRLGPVTG